MDTDYHQKEIDRLKEKLAEYQQYVMNLPIYEYHIDRIKVEKVKGILQIGELLDEEELLRKGIHKIFVKDIIIREIEGSGIVGIGLTEKDTKEKADKKRITPEEASKRTKEIYEKIKDRFELQDVPLFFQQLATKEKVLKEVWRFIKGNKYFVNKVKALVAESKEIMKEVEQALFSGKKATNLIQNQPLCSKINAEINDLLITYAIVIQLLSHLLSGFLSEEGEKVKISKLDEIKEKTVDKVFKEIKRAYYLSFLTNGFKQLENHDSLLFMLYEEWYIPLNQANRDREFIKELQAKIDRLMENIEAVEFEECELDVEKQSFLYSVLIEHYHSIPKWIYLDEVIAFVCASSLENR